MDDAARLTNLEEKFAFLEQSLQQLDQAILGQERRLEQIEMKILRVVSDVQTLSSVAQPDDNIDEVPPHY
jgi:uncharacterized coiled-coil protein SlyX